MTGPGASGASRMRVAGVALLAIAAVAAVVGLISLGGADSTTAAAPPSAVGTPLPAATSSAVPPASPAPAPVGVPPADGSGGGAPVAAAPIVPGPDAAGGAANGAASGSGGGSGGSGGGGVATFAGVPFRVLNNSMIVGLADRAASQMRDAGWTITGVGNYPGGIIPTSTIYYRPGTSEQAAAEAAASEFGVRVSPRFPGIADASPGVIVIATSDWGTNAAGTKGS